MSEIKRDSFKLEQLFFAAISGDTEKIKELVEEKKVDIDAQDQEGRTPLYFAVWNGHEEVARLLLKAGANTELKDNSGMTSLHIAAYLGIVKIVGLLLADRANREAIDIHGQTPLEKAEEFKMQKAHHKIIELLKQ